MISEDQLTELTGWFHPILAVCLLAAIVDLGAPLDFHLILGAGLYTAIYIAARAFGKYFGAPAVWELDGPTITGPTISNRFMGFPPLPDIILSVFPNLSIAQKDAIIRKKTNRTTPVSFLPLVKNTLRSGKCSGSKGAFSVSFQIEQGFQMVAV